MQSVTNKTLELFKLLVVWDNIAFCMWLQPLASWNLIPFYLPKREDREMVDYSIIEMAMIGTLFEP
jgi:hypothetical protein